MNERILKMPRLGETMEEGRIAGFLVKPGDSFKRGDSIIEIETDKTVAEFPALGDGTLNEWIGAIGDHVAVGAPLARIDIGAGPDWTEEGGENASSPQAPVASPVETDLAMPRLGETMDEGRIVRWLKSAGDVFARGEALLEIETDKTVAEFPALADGRLVEILGQEGEMVTVGEAIARIAVAADAASQDSAASVPDRAPAPEAPRAAPAVRAQEGQRVRATPLARRIARQNGIDINRLHGTGRRGRIEKEDVLAARGPRPSNSDVDFAELRGGRVAYLDQGPRDAPVFLLLHGFSGDRTTWSGIASGLRHAHFRVIAPDLPAHGLTTIEAGDAGELGAFLPAFLDSIGVDRVHVVAHSLGAVAAAGFAAASPERVTGLTLIAPAGLGSEIDAGFISGMALATAPGEIAHLLRRIAARPVDLSPERLADLAKAMAGGRLRMLGQAVAGPSGQRADIVGPLEKLARSMAVQVLFGLQDRIIPWQQITALPPRVGIHLLAQSGHMPQWDQTKEVLDLILRFAGGADD